MIIVGTFEQSIELEQTISVLEKRVVAREKILVVFMDQKPLINEFTGRTRNIHSNAFEVGMATGTGTAVIGASIGFVLKWGPIIWGLITVVIGFILGYVIYFLLKRKFYQTRRILKIPEATVIIDCEEHQEKLIKDILWKGQALTVGKNGS
ncbi:hypothetical protein [Evansella cellulosilytica]|uniref:Uncharacterized protein n=1 Tax=Evansella cellulosilytica (strain ATCC 21833 / DSM 2522 / FERM P-1141 / JCM 9156 / N-4) TaxID=649639 RepID=E6TXJ4_EVAC2|nr:hypothetical protein [Evansella cellulosilytica]ADU28808.1 hypothetical protein Bcell_0526 [Evansella cellulosilytica DSM 2522]